MKIALTLSIFIFLTKIEIYSRSVRYAEYSTVEVEFLLLYLELIIIDKEVKALLFYIKTRILNLFVPSKAHRFDIANVQQRPLFVMSK